MLVNFFTIKIIASIYENTIEKLNKDFGENIPKPLPYEGGILGFITKLFCVDANINVEEISKKYNCEISELYKIDIENHTYNNNYKVNRNYFTINKPKFYLELKK